MNSFSRGQKLENKVISPYKMYLLEKIAKGVDQLENKKKVTLQEVKQKFGLQ